VERDQDDLLESDAHAEVQAEAEEAAVPDAFISCRTGEIVLVGIVPDEEGRVTIPEDLANLIAARYAGVSS
jgi:hypothetical protein